MANKLKCTVELGRIVFYPTWWQEDEEGHKGPFHGYVGGKAILAEDLPAELKKQLQDFVQNSMEEWLSQTEVPDDEQLSGRTD